VPTHAELAKIHIAAKELGLADEEYRSLLWVRYKKNSAKDLSKKQTWDLVSHFQRLGWKPRYRRKAQGTRRKGKDLTQATDPQSRKIRALWITMHKAGLVHDPSEAALGAFVKRMAKVDRLAWAKDNQKARIIEALKKWQARDLAETVGAHYLACCMEAQAHG
jgi:phage gp16-like protein